MTPDSGAAGAAKTALLTLGSFISTQGRNPGGGIDVLWWITAIYGVLQIVKCIPWFTDLIRSFWVGACRCNWSRWFGIAHREEATNDDSPEDLR